MSEYDDLIDDRPGKPLIEVLDLEEGPLPDEQPEPETVLWCETGTLGPKTKWPVVRRCSISEEAYVQYELAITQAQMENGWLKEVIDPRPGKGKGKGRMWRSEQYLRWRYRGFRAGQISSL